jgi:hypothetical protein
LPSCQALKLEIPPEVFSRFEEQFPYPFSGTFLNAVDILVPLLLKEPYLARI